jgi:hypothetical protein
VGKNKEARALSSHQQRAARQEVYPIRVSSFTSLDHLTMISREGHIVDASATGFLLAVERKALLPKQFRDALSLDDLTGAKVILRLEEMNLEIGGVVTRTQRKAKDLFEIAIDFSEDAPEFWRECLMDLLPRPGEID